jgi:hypothetical protein
MNFTKRRAKKKKEYKNYIGSPNWKITREKILSRTRICFTCRTPHNLDVHHLTYRSFEREDIADLLVLCRSCHNFVHYENGKKLPFREQLMWRRVLTLKKRFEEQN